MDHQTTMMADETNTDVQKRIARAQSQPMNTTVVDTDPLVVQVHNEESDRIHTVVVESVHCSCEDHTYRGICKHLIALMQSDEAVGQAMQEAVKQKRNDLFEETDRLYSELEQIQERIEAIEQEREQITAILNELDLSHASEQVGYDTADTLADEDREETDALGELVERVTGDSQ